MLRNWYTQRYRPYGRTLDSRQSILRGFNPAVTGLPETASSPGGGLFLGDGGWWDGWEEVPNRALEAGQDVFAGKHIVAVQKGDRAVQALDEDCLRRRIHDPDGQASLCYVRRNIDRIGIESVGVGQNRIGSASSERAFRLQIAAGNQIVACNKPIIDVYGFVSWRRRAGRSSPGAATERRRLRECDEHCSSAG